MTSASGGPRVLRIFDREDPNAPRFRKLSVLMPVYNERWTLAEIVRRVLDAPVSLELELVAVDDASSDGSADILLRLAETDSRIKVFRHHANRGKGAALRTAIARMTGDVAVVQDADLEYDPDDYPRLLAPLAAGDADAVFGSRFAGHPRRVLPFFHRLINQSLTLASNLATDLTLTDMETCYKMVRADILRQLRLRANSFTFEPELTCRLAQWGARIYEVPVRYQGRSAAEGKKIRPRDGIKALAMLAHCRWIDTEFTLDRDLYEAARQSPSERHARALAAAVAPFCGGHVFAVGAARGGLAAHFTTRERLSIHDPHPRYRSYLHDRFGARGNVSVSDQPLDDTQRLGPNSPDTVIVQDLARIIRHPEAGLPHFTRSLRFGGHAVLVAPGRSEGWIDASRESQLSRDMQALLNSAGLEAIERFRVLSWKSRWTIVRGAGEARTVVQRMAGLFEPLGELLPGCEASTVLVGRKIGAPILHREAA